MRNGEVKHSRDIRESDMLRYNAAHGARAALGYAGPKLTLTEIKARPGYYFVLAHKPIGPYATADAAREAFGKCKSV